MKAQKFILLLFVTLLFIACNNNKKEIKVADISLKDSITDPGPPYDTNQLIKRFNEYTQVKPESAIVVEAPKTNPSNRDVNDPSFLKIKVFNDNYAISFLNKILQTNNINVLETFLQKNKDLINKDKVLVIGFENSAKYKNFVNLLSKYGITKFRVNSE